jgi:hypothetical protein
MNAGYSFQDFELIESAFFAVDTSSVTFNNLQNYATEYSHLQLRIVAQDNVNSSTARVITLRFNNDSGTNYTQHHLLGNGTSVISQRPASTASISSGNIIADKTTASSFGAVIIDILDFSNQSKNTVVRILGGYTSTASQVLFGSGVWFNTSVINSIFVGSGVRTYSAGSRISLYGIR